jgi:nucleotide-binding universal stress UspA family protein
VTATDEVEPGRGSGVAEDPSVPAGFTSIIVALDLEANGDRALPVARALAERGHIPVELLTVSSPGVDEDVDAYELRRRTMANNWPEGWYTIAHSNRPAEAIVDHVERRDGALLMMATSAKPLIEGQLFGNVVERLLGVIDQPVLLVGPRVADTFAATPPTLIICLDRTDIGEAAVPAIARWAHTFGAAEVWATEVAATAPDDATPGTRAAEHVRAFADLLGSSDVKASWGVLFGEEQDVRLELFADSFSNPIFVATSVRWTDGQPHWRSSTHQLVHRSKHPVLVVPASSRRHAPTALRLSVRR